MNVRLQITQSRHCALHPSGLTENENRRLCWYQCGEVLEPCLNIMYGLVFEPGSIPMCTGPSLLLCVRPLLHDCGAGIWQCLALSHAGARWPSIGPGIWPAASIMLIQRQLLLLGLNPCWQISLNCESVLLGTKYLRQFQSYWQHPKEFISIQAHLESHRLSAWTVLLLGCILYKCVFCVQGNKYSGISRIPPGPEASGQDVGRSLNKGSHYPQIPKTGRSQCL